jgi:hypothetical protein
MFVLKLVMFDPMKYKCSLRNTPLVILYLLEMLGNVSLIYIIARVMLKAKKLRVEVDLS